MVSANLRDKRRALTGQFDIIMSHQIAGPSNEFGPVVNIDSLEEYSFPLSFKGQQEFRFFTRRTHRLTGKVPIRYLVLHPIDPNAPIYKVMFSSTDTPMRCYVEVCTTDPEHTTRRLVVCTHQLEDILMDPKCLPPHDTGAEFFIRLVTVGRPQTRRQLELNAHFSIEIRGSYPHNIELMSQAHH